ncbi:MAG: DUF1080 domain-containing protein [Cytophagales bacterium]|nr:DUF1080 domain-containing protein [Cytophagales bacterium]
MKWKNRLVAIAMMFAWNVQAQTEDGYSFSILPLTDLKAFRPQAGNWQIAGSASAHPDKRLDLQITAGTGILVNLPNEQKKDDLFTLMEHGDIELILEFMTPRESNSGIYFMGRYELQILDSYTRITNGSARPDKHDCAAIYERWDDSKPEGQKGYEGRPPRENVTRAPGLWQHYHVIFQAPRFNEKGEKIANAKFVKVFHNGVLVHENVEVSGPTRGSAFANEAPRGPLRIQGDHGPVAFRNIRYRLYNKPRLQVENVTAVRYKGTFDKDLPDWKTLQPEQTLSSPEGITWQVSTNNEPGALLFNGTVIVPESGTYFFGLECNGAGSIWVNGKKLVEKTGENWRGNIKLGKIDLKAGKYPLQVFYAKWIDWQPALLGVYAEGPEIARHALHAAGSVPPPSPTPIIHVHPTTAKPYLLRAFIEHNGKQYTHAISVGYSSRMNYALDLNQGKLICAWRGGFIDAAPIWHSRGGGNVKPLGSIIDLQPAPLAASLATEQAPFPDSVGIRYKSMELDAQGLPTFRYTMGHATLSDRIVASDNGKELQRTITVDQMPENTYVRLAKGSIKTLQEGLFVINDTYYVRASATMVKLRTVNGQQELLWKVPPATSAILSYQIVF